MEETNRELFEKVVKVAQARGFVFLMRLLFMVVSEAPMITDLLVFYLKIIYLNIGGKTLIMTAKYLFFLLIQLLFKVLKCGKLQVI